MGKCGRGSLDQDPEDKLYPTRVPIENEPEKEPARHHSNRKPKTALAQDSQTFEHERCGTGIRTEVLVDSTLRAMPLRRYAVFAHLMETARANQGSSEPRFV